MKFLDVLKEAVSKFWAENGTQIIEAAKTLIRNLSFLAIGWFVSYFLQYVAVLPQTTGTVLVYSALTYIDKWIHENWLSNDKTGTRGLFPL